MYIYIYVYVYVYVFVTIVIQLHGPFGTSIVTPGRDFPDSPMTLLQAWPL